MELNKKSMFFTFIAFIFLALVIFSISIGNNYKLREKSFVIETRVDTMNRFVKDIDKDIERGAYIIGIRSFFALNDYIITTGEYISDLNSSFNELFVNGTIENNVSAIMINNTFTDWINKISLEAAKIDLITNFTIYNTSLSQNNPWEVIVDVSLNIKIDDKKNISSWNREKSIQSIIEIEGLEDPTYWIGTGSIVTNKIIKTNFTFTYGNITNLTNHAKAGYYIEFNGAPSYLMRFQGDFNSSPYGIESLAGYLLDDNFISVQDKSIVDYIYFSSSNPSKYYIPGTPSWFKLDNLSNTDNNQTHLELYKVDDIVS